MKTLTSALARTGLRNPSLLREEGFDEEVRWLIRNEVKNEDLRSLRELHVGTKTPLFDTLVGAERDPTFDCKITSKAKSERERERNGKKIEIETIMYECTPCLVAEKVWEKEMKKRNKE